MQQTRASTTQFFERSIIWMVSCKSLWIRRKKLLSVF